METGGVFVVDSELLKFIINGFGLICESGWVLSARFVKKFPPAGWVTGCTIWVTGSDTTFVHSQGDSVVIFDFLHYWDSEVLRDTFIVSQRFSFPLQVGKVWLNQGLDDSLSVEAEDSIEVFPGDVRRAFRIVERNHGWCYVDYQCWLVSGLGMVKMRGVFGCDSIGYEWRMRLLKFRAPQ